MKIIVFDMDGTLNDLYGYTDWLGLLKAEDVSPYRLSEPLWDMARLNTTLEMLKALDYTVGVITWLADGGSKEYGTDVRQAKLDWLTDYDMPIDFFHCVKYGTTKANTIRKMLKDCEEAILIDDNEKIRKGWHYGRTINPTEVDILDFLDSLVG